MNEPRTAKQHNAPQVGEVEITDHFIKHLNCIENAPRGSEQYSFNTAVAAELARLKSELSHVDSVLARRPALADCKNRCEAIEKAINTAKETDRLKAELETERKQGQEVHDYLVSVNPDNSLLSVLEACIQQRGIENRLKASNEALREAASKLLEACRLADHVGELYESVTGELMDAVALALSAKPM